MEIIDKIKKKYLLHNLAGIDYSVRINEIERLSRKFYNMPDIFFKVEGDNLVSYQKKIERSKLVYNQVKLEEFSLFLDQINKEGFVHGDINKKNVIYDGKDYFLIDLEPSLYQYVTGKKLFKVTKPYISIQDMKDNVITDRTDKIGFYYFILRIQNKLKAQDIPDLVKKRIKLMQNTLPMEEEEFCQLSFYEIFLLTNKLEV